MSSIEVPVIAGDGIGPEITAAVLKVVDAAVERNGASLKWVPVTAGLSALDEGSELIPQRTLDEIARCRVALKGPCTTPVGEGFTSINVKLRKTFNLYAAVRPVRAAAFDAFPFLIIRFTVLRREYDRCAATRY